MIRRSITAICFAATMLLLANPGVSSAQWIEDSAGLFSVAAREQAAKGIDDFDERYGLGLWIETFTRLPPARQQAYESRKAGARDAVLREWAEERAREKDVQGVYVLIWRDTGHDRAPFRVRAVARTEAAEKVFGGRERQKLQQIFENDIERQHADDALRSAVRYVHETMLDATRPAFHWLWLVWVLTGLAAVWLLAALLRLRLHDANPDVMPGLVLPPIGAGMLGGMVGLMGRFPVSKEGYRVLAEPDPSSVLPEEEAATLPYGPVETTPEPNPSAPGE